LREVKKGKIFSSSVASRRKREPISASPCARRKEKGNKRITLIPKGGSIERSPPTREGLDPPEVGFGKKEKKSKTPCLHRVEAERKEKSDQLIGSSEASIVSKKKKGGETTSSTP